MLPISTDFIEFVQRAAFAGEDVLRRFGPDEGLRLLVVKQQVVVDRVLEIVDALVAAPADAPVRDLGEEAFDQPCAACCDWRRELRAAHGRRGQDKGRCHRVS